MVGYAYKGAGAREPTREEKRTWVSRIVVTRNSTLSDAMVRRTTQLSATASRRACAGLRAPAAIMGVLCGAVLRGGGCERLRGNHSLGL